MGNIKIAYQMTVDIMINLDREGAIITSIEGASSFLPFEMPMVSHEEIEINL